MFDEMIANSEEFYQALGIPYRIVNIVSGMRFTLKRDTCTVFFFLGKLRIRLSTVCDYS